MVIFIVVALVLLYVTAPLWSVQVSVPAAAAKAQCVLAVPVNVAPVYVRPAGTACVVFAGVPADGVNVAVAVSTCVYTTVPPGATFAGAAASVIVNCAPAGDAYMHNAKSAHSSGASIERKRGERRVPAWITRRYCRRNACNNFLPGRCSEILLPSRSSQTALPRTRAAGVSFC